MKKILISVLLVIAMLITSICAIAEIDFSEMTLDELLEVQEQLTTAIEEAQKTTQSEETQDESISDLDSSGYKEITKGSKGDDVKAIQTRLFDLGFYSKAIDGDYGNGTINAIKAFEEYNGLEQTDIATPELQAFLFSEKAKHKDIPVASIKVDGSNLTALVGSMLNIAELVVINPENATEKGVTFELEDNEFAEINENGILTGKKRGDVTVTISSNEKVEKPKSTTVKVKVRQPVETISLADEEFNVGNGSTHQLEAKVGPEDADNKSVVWTSDNPEIATVSKNGSVKGVDTGTTTITCTAGDGSGVSATATVTVITAVKKVSFSDKSKTLIVGEYSAPERASRPAELSTVTGGVEQRYRCR